jgi:hypothetical protein
VEAGRFLCELRYVARKTKENRLSKSNFKNLFLTTISLLMSNVSNWGAWNWAAGQFFFCPPTFALGQRSGRADFPRYRSLKVLQRFLGS